MSDEQYIDDLFACEAVGMDKTPGFRDFVLDLMGMIGERPRAGDVCSMHLAYKAGLEHGPNWTPDRPTKPGDYWFSLPVANRVLFASPDVVRCVVFASECALPSLHVSWMDADGCCRILSLQKDKLDGALWAPRETPADPFAKPETMRTDQDGREYNHDDREQKLNPDALVKKAIQHLRRRKPKNGRGYVYPLWKRVADLFGHGSGYSAEICRRHGFDPDEQWTPEEVTSC